MGKKRLKGITWDHTRGFTPMIATAQRFSEMYPDVEISWEKRSLQAFADESVVALAGRYDLLVIDHPWMGAAAAADALIPLDGHLSGSLLKTLAAGSVGRSFDSYRFGGKQWALPLDAAAPVAAYRPDLISSRALALPATYDELVKMASLGVVIAPGLAIDVLMHFYMICCSLGEPPFPDTERFVSKETGSRALSLLNQLFRHLDARCFDWNPVRVYEAMAATDSFAYCPFAYGYSNYARKGYAPKQLNFHDLVSLTGQGKLISTLGGTGIAISRHTTHLPEALAYVAYVAGPACQKTLYFDNGGQPGHIDAWTDSYTNVQCAGFFRATLPALKRAFLRPCYPGYTTFQDEAGPLVRAYLMEGGDEGRLMKQLNKMYHDSTVHETA